jgi:hypothetical protein
LSGLDGLINAQRRRSSLSRRDVIAEGKGSGLALVSLIDVIKAAAVAAMLTDHVGEYLFPEALWMRMIGRSGLVMWFFLIGYGGPRPAPATWVVIGVVMTATRWASGASSAFLNVLLNLALIRLLLGVIERRGWTRPEHVAVMAVAALVLWLPSNMVLDYGSEGFMLALGGYALRRSHKAHDWTPWQARGAVAIAASLSMVLQIVVFEFPWPLAVGVVIGMSGFALALMQVRPGQRAYVPTWLGAPTRFLSRHTLVFYAAPLMTFYLLVIWRGFPIL